MDSFYNNDNNFGGYGPGPDRFGHRHPFGPNGEFGPWGPLRGQHDFPFGFDPSRRAAFGPEGFGPHRRPGGFGFGPEGFGFGPHRRGGPFGPRGRGGFGPWGPCRRGPKPQESSSSSSEDEEKKKKKPEEETSSDSSSDSEVECHRKGRRHGRKHHGRRHCHGGHGRHGRHPFWPPHHHRHGPWPPHHHHHWGFDAAPQEEDVAVEEASQFGSDFQVLQDDVSAQMNNLQLQEENGGPQDRSTKKWFRVALNAEGFKVKDIRIRLHQNKLLVEGKQNVKNALGSFQRSFAYSITVPGGVDTKKMKTKLGPDGILRIKAKKVREETDNEEIQVIEE